MNSGILLSKKFVERFDAELSQAESGPGLKTTRIIIDVDNDQVISDGVLNEVRVAFFSNDVRYRRDVFLETLTRAKNLQWLQSGLNLLEGFKIYNGYTFLLLA